MGAACDTVKLRGVPKADATKQVPKGACGRGNDLGYGKNASDATMDNPQPSPEASSPPGGAKGMDAVQRLNGGGFCHEMRLAHSDRA